MKKELIFGALGVFMVVSSCNTKEQKAKAQSCLRINFKEEPTSMDPRRGRNMSGASHLHTMLFEGLMKHEPNGDLKCAQAQSYEVSPDQKTYTFHLGNNFWSDGTPVTAYDFENTWKNILDPLFPALDSHLLYSIKNANAAKNGEIPLDNVGIHSKDAKTLVVELEHPTPHFLQITASSSLYPINQTQALHYPNWFADAGSHFVCNGPFKLNQWKHNNKIILEKNNRYRLADQVKLDEVQISIINNESAALHMHESGDLDIIGLPISPLPLDAYPDLIGKDQLQVFEAPGTMVCMFNTKIFPFYNTNIRKAFSYALDRKLLIDNITQLRENPALGIVPPHLKKTPTEPHFEDGNAELARACLKKGLEELGIQASDLNGKTTFSYWANDHACPMLPQAMQQQWRQVLGVQVELEALEYKTLHEKGKNGLLSMGYFVFLSMYQDPIELLERFKSAQTTRNYARWQNEKYTDLVTRAGRATSEQEHFALLDQAEKIFIDEMPYAPIFHWNYAMLVQPHVKGFEVSPLGYFCFDRVHLEKTGVQ
jgi:oligopeptide transport system substrate-binding protein